MSVLSDHDRETVRARLAGITRPVTLLFFTQTFGAPDSVLTARQLLGEMVDLHELISVEEVNFVLDTERVAAFGVDRIPAIAILAGGEDTRLRFVGAPDGYEFLSLVDAVRLAGSGDSGLSPDSRALIAAHVTAPTEILVFVTPTCPHCPRAVTLAHRMALESPHIRATCVEATEFLDLSQQYRVTGVPKTVVNGTVEILGALPEDAFIRAALQLPEQPSGA